MVNPLRNSGEHVQVLPSLTPRQEKIRLLETENVKVGNRSAFDGLQDGRDLFGVIDFVDNRRVARFSFKVTKGSVALVALAIIFFSSTALCAAGLLLPHFIGISLIFCKITFAISLGSGGCALFAGWLNWHPTKKEIKKYRSLSDNAAESPINRYNAKLDYDNELLQLKICKGVLIASIGLLAIAIIGFALLSTHALAGVVITVLPPTLLGGTSSWFAGVSIVTFCASKLFKKKVVLEEKDSRFSFYKIYYAFQQRLNDATSEHEVRKVHDGLFNYLSDQSARFAGHINRPSFEEKLVRLNKLLQDLPLLPKLAESAANVSLKHSEASELFQRLVEEEARFKELIICLESEPLFDIHGRSDLHEVFISLHQYYQWLNLLAMKDKELVNELKKLRSILAPPQD